jgi:hypothetical protein
MRYNRTSGTALGLTLLGLVLAGCKDSTGPDGPDISLFGLIGYWLVDPPVMRVDIGGRRRTVEFNTSGARPGIPIEIQGPRYGEVPVSVVLVSSDGDSLAGVEFVQLFERGSDHWVQAFVGPTRPLSFCIGTIEAAPLPADAFPEVGEVRDTLFVHHGRTPKGAVCGPS